MLGWLCVLMRHHNCNTWLPPLSRSVIIIVILLIVVGGVAAIVSCVARFQDEASNDMVRPMI